MRRTEESALKHLWHEAKNVDVAEEEAKCLQVLKKKTLAGSFTKRNCKMSPQRSSMAFVNAQTRKGSNINPY